MNIAEQKYRALQSLARASDRSMQELLTLYALECFLSRVAQSPMRENLVLKGGVLLAAFDARRPTRDIDFSGVNIDNDAKYILTLCSEIGAIVQDDGIVFDFSVASVETIRDDDEYSGVRVSIIAVLHTARISFHIDLSVGDPIVPGAREIELPRILENMNQINLLGYPISMVLAEKAITAIQRGTANTRWRDFGDIYQLSRRLPISSKELMNAMRVVAEHRSVEILGLEDSLTGYSEIGQTKYENWRRKQDRLELPENFGELLAAVFAFTDSLIAADPSADLQWDPLILIWR